MSTASDDYQKIPLSLVASLKQKPVEPFTANSGPLSDRKGNVKLPPLAVMTTSQPVNNSTCIWNHPKQRQKIKYLLNNTQCVCGAGRDISFLNDANDTLDSSMNNLIPETIIPEEYHIIKHPGVLGLDLHDEHYSTVPCVHDRHYTVFPSMRPSGRQEVIDLKNTLTQMLGQGGITEYVLETDMSGPSQMHKLISLVKKEQEIYNICFHELIRQVTVQCAERGALLSDIRQCYAHLLNSIPLQVKSLHDEIVAQRTLDKKLITELSRFHGLLTKLTYELSGLKDHNELAGEEIEETKEKLLLALSESEKNANLLVEYSHLYELQRKRLEDHIATTSQERELWECTCYKLAVTVADQHKLNSVEQLQLTGRSWEKLATHFTITLSDVDTKQLCIIQSEIHQWKNDLAQFVRLLNETENNINTKLNTVYEDMNLWFVKLKQLRSESGSTADVLDRDGILELWQAMTYWLTTLNELSDMFSGEKLLNFQEQLHQVDQRMDKWKEIALTIMKRHIKPSAVNNQTESSDELQESTTVLVQRINSFMKHLSTRGSGENGIAIAFVRLITPMESWDTQFNLITGCSGKSFTETDYTKFVSQVESWLDLLSSSSTIITTNNNSHQQE
jgi:hypothetical protein